MAKAAQHNTSTQRFTEIKDIKENIVILEGGNASIIIEIKATNFSLLSREEQDGKMFAYASLLNSLSFPVQIIVRSKQIQILPYLKLLDSERRKTANPKLSIFIQQYRDFIENLVTVSSVLDKQFYLAIGYSSLEGSLTRATKGTTAEDMFFQGAKTSLRTKADSVMSLLQRVGLRSEVLGEEELTKLFYDIYNQGDQEFQGNIKDATDPVIVQRQRKV